MMRGVVRTNDLPRQTVKPSQRTGPEPAKGYPPYVTGAVLLLALALIVVVGRRVRG